MQPDRFHKVLRLPRIEKLLIIIAGVFLVLGVLAGWAITVQAQPAQARFSSPDRQGAAGGQTIFNEKCIGCHSIGGGKLVGPDLKDVTKRRDIQWIKSFIADPAKMIATDATAKQLLQENNNITMPTLGLSAQEIDAVVVYLSNPGAVPAAPAVPAGVGDPAVGQKIFMGEMPLANGGTSCIACHNVAGTGLLGGGGLGPDLTHVVQRLGEPGLAASLKTIAFPTMIGPFLNKPLTPTEQTDLVAFLRSMNQLQGPVTAAAPGSLSTQALIVFGIAIAGMAVLFGILLVFWPRQKLHDADNLPVRKPMLSKRRPS